jgi:hypothetical protein
MLNKTYIILAVVAVVVVAAVVFVATKKEKYADYPGTNEFMSLYYSNVAEDPAFEKKFPFYGTGDKVGLRCRGPNNKDCDTMWLGGKLVEITPKIVKGLECRYGMPFVDILKNIV